MKPSKYPTPPAHTDWAELFLSASGRMKNMPFVIASAILLAFALLFHAAFDSSARFFFGWLVYPVLFYCGACVLSKRLHDRGKSGWWAAVILLCIMMIWPFPLGFIDFLAALFLVWSFGELVLMPSERGTNRFGPPIATAKTFEDSLFDDDDQGNSDLTLKP